MAYRRFVWKFGGRRRTTEMSSIPEEIYYEILLRLPVKSLLTCKGVCKNWYALISTSGFVKTYVTIQKNNPILMLEANRYFYSMAYDSFPSSPVCEIKDDVIKVDHPHHCVGFLGSCNGLFCIRIWLLVGRGYNRDVLCLWNPSTGEYKELPESPIGFRRDNVYMVLVMTTRLMITSWQ
ncbi:F-box protein At5g49610-like [Papaver somniferum]|uniref:F-box protein At5g49610-like n=1 Tax=Papaver somniferum TaxID=3469 RepID=UPI000E6FAB76|nr:F-box protein At5g49610-like [Papaver somniferum]